MTGELYPKCQNSRLYIGRNKEDVKGYLKKRKHSPDEDMLPSSMNGNEIKGLPTAAFCQNWQHIGHHCGCDDEQLDRDLLHDITSFRIDF